MNDKPRLDAVPIKCVGIVGRLAGHRFRVFGVGSARRNVCLRCGVEVTG